MRVNIRKNITKCLKVFLIAAIFPSMAIATEKCDVQVNGAHSFRSFQHVINSVTDVNKDQILKICLSSGAIVSQSGQNDLTSLTINRNNLQIHGVGNFFLYYTLDSDYKNVIKVSNAKNVTIKGINIIEYAPYGRGLYIGEESHIKELSNLTVYTLGKVGTGIHISPASQSRIDTIKDITFYTYPYFGSFDINEAYGISAYNSKIGLIKNLSFINMTEDSRAANFYGGYIGEIDNMRVTNGTGLFTLGADINEIKNSVFNVVGSGIVLQGVGPQGSTVGSVENIHITSNVGPGFVVGEGSILDNARNISVKVRNELGYGFGISVYEGTVGSMDRVIVEGGGTNVLVWGTGYIRSLSRFSLKNTGTYSVQGPGIIALGGGRIALLNTGVIDVGSTGGKPIVGEVDKKIDVIEIPKVSK